MSKLPPDQRPSARQLAAQSAGSGGYACPRCGCRDWRGERNSSVESTRHPVTSGGIRRRRICRHCGQESFITEEVIVPDGHKLVVIPEEEEEYAA